MPFQTELLHRLCLLVSTLPQPTLHLPQQQVLSSRGGGSGEDVIGAGAGVREAGRDPSPRRVRPLQGKLPDPAPPATSHRIAARFDHPPSSRGARSRAPMNWSCAANSDNEITHRVHPVCGISARNWGKAGSSAHSIWSFLSLGVRIPFAPAAMICSQPSLSGRHGSSTSSVFFMTGRNPTLVPF